MNPWEQSVLDRLEKEGNPLGWKPKGRDERGYGIIEATLPAGPGKLKIARAILTPEGVEHDSRPRIIDAN